MCVLDVNQWRDICGDDLEFWSAVLDEYARDGEITLKQLRETLERTDRDNALRTLHRLKGASRTVGATEIATITAALESSIQANGISALEFEIDRLEQGWERFMSQYETILREEAA
jgi:HPt (histidine-containing phosphotransfer) domain-containing protein